MPILTILLDSNEYIFGLSESKQESARLLRFLSFFSVRLPRFVLEELYDNLDQDLLKSLYKVIKKEKVEVIEEQISASLVEKYKNQLPPEDAVIAAYCEFLKVDVLISENRHFLTDLHTKTFQVMSARDFLEQYR